VIGTAGPVFSLFASSLPAVPLFYPAQVTVARNRLNSHYNLIAFAAGDDKL